MLKFDLVFMTLAAACLVGGVSLGIYMGLNHDFSLAPVHAHLNLVGWASLALFGLAYRAYPDLQRSRLAYVHLALSGLSGPMFPLAIYFAIFHDDATLTRIAAPMWFMGAVVFLVGLLRLAFVKAPHASQRAASGSSPSAA